MGDSSSRILGNQPVDCCPARNSQLAGSGAGHPAQGDHRAAGMASKAKEPDSAQRCSAGMRSGLENRGKQHSICAAGLGQFAQGVGGDQPDGPWPPRQPLRRSICSVRTPSPGLLCASCQYYPMPEAPRNPSKPIKARAACGGWQVIMAIDQPAAARQAPKCSLKPRIIARIADQPDMRVGLAQRHGIAIAARHE